MSEREIFVGNLAKMDQQELKDEFNKFGEMNRLSFKGHFAFIEYKSSESARDAIKEMDGERFLGQRLRVNGANDKPSRRGDDRRDRGGRRGDRDRRDYDRRDDRRDRRDYGRRDRDDYRRRDDDRDRRRSRSRSREDDRDRRRSRSRSRDDDRYDGRRDRDNRGRRDEDRYDRRDRDRDNRGRRDDDRHDRRDRSSSRNRSNSSAHSEVSPSKRDPLNGVKKWLATEPFGKPIRLPNGKHVVAFKTPRTDLQWKSQNLSQKDVVDHYSNEHSLNVRFIIDLTNTDKYYEFEATDEPKIEYYNMKTAGKEVPSEEFLEDFMARMETCIEKMDKSEDVIGIHCTHGVNRAGYLIVYYLCKKHDIPLKEALDMFDEHRDPHMISETTLLRGLADTFDNPEEAQDWLNDREKKAETYETDLER